MKFTVQQGHRPPLGKQILEENGKHTVTKKNCDFVSIFNIPIRNERELRELMTVYFLPKILGKPGR